MKDCYNFVGLPADSFMFKTIISIAQEHGINDQRIIDKTYEELYSISDAVGKSWNCTQIDRILKKKMEEYK